MRYLIYARVSPKGSKWSSNETSVPTQIEECKEYVKAVDRSPEFMVLYDEHFSGKNLKRPAVQQLLSEIVTDRWDCLVVWHMDRLSRSIADAIPIFKALQDANKGLISVRQNIDFHSAGGRFALHIFTAAAQYEREMCAERVKMKMDAMLEQGLYVGVVPYGYKKSPDDKYLLVRDEPKATYVQRVFQLYIEDRLTAEKIKEMKLSKQTAYDLVTRIIYTGKVKFGNKIYQGRHEPLVSQEVFDEAVAKRARTSQDYYARPSTQTYKYRLAGLIKCKCGFALTPHSVVKKNNHRYHYYKCKNCGMAVSAKKLDEYIIRDITLKMQTSPVVENSIAEHFARFSSGDDLSQTISELNKKLDKAKKDRDIATQFFFDGIVNQTNKDYFNDMLATANQQVKELEAQKEDLVRKQEIRLQAAKNAVEMRKLLRETFNQLNPESDQDIKKLLACINKIIAHDKESFEVVIIPGLIITDESNVMPNDKDWWCILDLDITFMSRPRLFC